MLSIENRMSRFSIKDIELLTGIKAHTLRIWEQRYDILKPHRSETNIRWYDDEELKLLLNISLLNEEGHRISQIAKLSREEIQQSVINYSDLSREPSLHIRLLIAAMIQLDEAAFEKVLSTCILQHGVECTMMDVVFPFLNQIGLMWQTGTIHPAYEHFISNLIRQKLMVAIDGQALAAEHSAKKFLLFLPEGEDHEIGLLFGNYLIREAGHNSLYFGQSLPVADLGRVAKKYVPDVVLLSVSTGFSSGSIEEVYKGIRHIFPKAAILVCGRYFCNQQSLAADIHLIKTPQDLKSFFL